MWSWLKRYLDQKLIRPFRESKSPIGEVALGAMIGMFWAMTPLVGVQMTLVTIHWFLFRFFRWHFSLPIAMAMVWISNPVTMGPLYYLFYLAGFYFFVLLGIDITQVSYTAFVARLEQSLAMGGIDGSIDFVLYIIRDLGWPMLIGGFVVATPMSIVSYFVARRMVNAMRARKAHKEGLTLAEWEHRHVKLRDPLAEKKRLEELKELHYHLHDPQAIGKTGHTVRDLHRKHPVEEHEEPTWSLLHKHEPDGSVPISRKKPKKKRAKQTKRARKKTASKTKSVRSKKKAKKASAKKKGVRSAKKT